jgi:DNA-binding response OmpR family regulator
VAVDGETGLRLALSGRPDVTVVDVTLPGMSGIDLCRELRAGEGTASIPVVLVTGRSAEAEVRDGLAAGADDYVVKPFRTGDLVARIMALLPLPEVDPSIAPA